MAMLWLIKNKTELLLFVTMLLVSSYVLWRPANSAMNAVLAIIANGGRAIVDIEREGAFSPVFY